MIGAGERAYIYAKVCGIIGKSFVGKRVTKLSAVNRLSELDHLVFPGATRDLPEKELLPDFESRIARRSIEAIIAIVDCFQNPPELLSLLLRASEYADLKSTLSAIANREVKPPAFTELGHFRTIRFEAYPDLKAMLKNTSFDFLLKEDIVDDAILLQTKLDQHYYTHLWESLSRLSKKDRTGIEKIIGEEICLRNILWTLRLRIYYQMNIEQIEKMLISVNGQKFTADAIASLDFAPDTQADWAHWKWAKFVNKEKTGTFWKIEPRYFQNAAAHYLYRHTYNALRLRPFTLDTVFCFIRLKQFEEDLLTSIAEGFGFGMTSRETMNILEAL